VQAFPLNSGKPQSQPASEEEALIPLTNSAKNNASAGNGILHMSHMFVTAMQLLNTMLTVGVMIAIMQILDKTIS
jgi:hypothetical protein